MHHRNNDMSLRAVDVFTPNDFPTYTYIKRVGDDLEQRLRNAVSTPKMVVSVSGPSKSGKTVLVEKVVGQDNIIPVSGSLIKKSDDLWTLILHWMGTPSSETTQEIIGGSTQLSAKVGGRIKVPLLIEGSGDAGLQGTSTSSTSMSVTNERSGFAQVHHEIANSDYVVFIDDFHYMPREVQTEIAKRPFAKSGSG